jgi:4-alpha-glucanotransferase
MSAARSAENEPHPLLRERASGVLLHLSSVPGRYGVGDLGAGARSVVDWLERAGQRFWQMLPVQPIGPGDSPYSALSAFAGEPLFVDLEALVDEGWLHRRSLDAPAALGRGRTRYGAARAFRMPRLLAAFAGFSADGGERSAEYRRFLRENAHWLEDWCEYAAARDGGPEQFHAFVQFCFDRQWSALRGYARDRGVRLIGDAPIFVGCDSADVVRRPELFRLRRDGSPEVLTGVPPDSFSATGQLWGQPHYRWSEHRRTRFAWWVARFRRAAALFDLVRIDHFIGFHNAYEVPGGARDARRGRWALAPGAELLTAVRGALDELPLIAEDLGMVTPPVHALRDRFGLPGMRIVQNAFYGDDARDLPPNMPMHAVAYPGTHDNEVITGWWRSVGPEVRERFRTYVGATREPVWLSMLRATMQSPAAIVVAQLQDVLGLPRSTRMNLPGTPSGNWTWRAESAIFTASAARRLRDLTRATARLRDRTR